MSVLRAQRALLDRALLQAALYARRGNVTHAARYLGITRQSIHELMRKHGIDRSQFTPPSNRSPGADIPRTQREGGSSLDNWHHLGDVALQVVTDLTNRAKDRADEALDAQRVHDGKTLDEFLDK